MLFFFFFFYKKKHQHREYRTHTSKGNQFRAPTCSRKAQRCVELAGDRCGVVVQTISERTASERALPIAVTPNHRRSDQAIHTILPELDRWQKTPTIYKKPRLQFKCCDIITVAKTLNPKP
jgi:hypothetical protein